MKVFAGIVHSILTVTTPVMYINPGWLPSHCLKGEHYNYQQSIHIPDLGTLSYDEVVNLLHQIESGFIGENPSREQVDKINQFLAFLAMEGVTEREKPQMAAAVTELFRESALEYASLGERDFGYSLGAAIIQCKSKSWIERKAKAARKFIKKHKKAIIIGAIAVVTVTVVVVAAAAISAAAAGTAVAAGGTALASASSGESIVSSLKEEIKSFKETVAQEQLAAGSDAISLEENGRIIGSVFAHKTVDTFSGKVTENPAMAQEFNDLGFKFTSPKPTWSNPSITPHGTADLAFSTDYSSIPSWNGSQLNTLSYQARGDWALSSGHYTQASQDFTHAIDLNPHNPTSYLGRGIANFELGQYDNCIADYHSYVAQTTPRNFSWTEFSLGFARELPRGVCDSGEGLLFFLTDLAIHPFQTSQQVYESLQMLSGLVKSGEWGTIGGTLSPELHRLATEWDHLSDRERGELSGYAFGKLGADILIPGAAAKIAKSGVMAAKDLSVICKNLQNAKKVLVLEAIADGGAAGVKIEEVVCFAERTLEAGEDLGLTTQEMGALKEAGKLEEVIGKGRDYFNGKPELQASFDLFNSAEKELRKYTKEILPEASIRMLIHQQGIKTFPRPAGIPENYIVRITNKGAGMEYVHPRNDELLIRIMPGKPHSSFPNQQKPYVIQRIGGSALDVNGSLVYPRSPDAHIPLDKYIYRERSNYGK